MIPDCLRTLRCLFKQTDLKNVSRLVRNSRGEVHRGRVLLTLCAIIAIGSCPAAEGRELISYRTARYEGVIGQTDWFTCGPAALATLLTLFGEQTKEEDMLSLALDIEPDHSDGFSMFTLKEVLARKGLDSLGYQLTVNQLVDYFMRGGLPVVLHVTKPMFHFVVGVGMLGENALLIYDPSWGRRIVALRELTTMMGFSGVVLVPTPIPNLMLTARRNQVEALRWGVDQLHRLSRMKGGFKL